MTQRKIIYETILGAFTLLFPLAACTGNEVPVQEENSYPIRWNVISEGMKEGRTLINNNSDLQTACSGEHAIGIWSAYQLGDEYKVNILGNESGDVSLIYQLIPDWENWEGWTYAPNAANWKHGAIHYFNAYFPMTGGMISIQNTKDYIQGNFNTETTQTDLMVARVVVNTADNSFLGSPVDLPLKHALATLQFKFQMEEGTASENVLTSFSLDRTLRTSADLNYRSGNITIENWINRTASSSSRIYEWIDQEGLTFSAATAACPHTTGEGIYSTHEGRVFIIPQSCNVAPTFSCTIGTHTYDQISLGNKLFEPGKNYLYLIKMKENSLEVSLRIKAWNELDSSYDIIF